MGWVVPSKGCTCCARRAEFEAEPTLREANLEKRSQRLTEGSNPSQESASTAEKASSNPATERRASGSIE